MGGESREPLLQKRLLVGSRNIPFLQDGDGRLLFSTSPFPMRKLAGAYLTGSLATFWTADGPYDPLVLIVSSESAETFKLYHVLGATAAAETDRIAGKGQAVTVDDPQWLVGLGCRKGDTFQGLCSNTQKVVVAIYGAPGEL